MPPLRGVVRHLVIINVLLFVAVYFVFAKIPSTNTLTEFLRNTDVFLAMNYPTSDFFRPYQIFTHMFMHGNFQHLLFNMFALWMFGTVLEDYMGSKKFLQFYLICGFGAIALHMLVWYYEVSSMDPQYYAQYIRLPHRVLGASGAIYGLLAGYGLLYPNSRIMLLFPPIPMKAKYFVLIMAAIELSMGVSGRGTGVAHFAHLGGAIIGALLIKYWIQKR